MPGPGPGGGGARGAQGPGGAGHGGGGDHGGGRRRPVARERQGNEEIRKFLNFYKRRNSLCIDLYLPAFFKRKPSYDDLADLVYSVLSVGGASPPHVIRPAVLDIQLHPVKKLLFIKFTDQKIRDEVVARLQAGLLWTAFDTIVTGWSMDKPMERVRVLGTSPETGEAEIRLVLGQYGEIVDAQKGLISKKLPGCTNGIWTVKMFLGEGKSLPPFLIMKDDGEVWQLATGEASVCWKCGQSGHIGDKCRQSVNILAESLASPAVGEQPSWAHVVKGGVSLCVTPPPPPARPQVQQPANFKLSCGILKAAKVSLRVVQEPVIRRHDQVGAVLDEQALDMRAASMKVQLSQTGQMKEAEEPLPSRSSLVCEDNPQKKAKLTSDAVQIPRDPRLRTKGPGIFLASPELHHKVPVRVQLRDGPVEGVLLGVSVVEELLHGPVEGEQHIGPAASELRHVPVEGEQHIGPAVDELRHGVVSAEQPSESVEDGDKDMSDDARSRENINDIGVKTNMFGLKYLVWFDIGIEGKDPMDQEEDDWGGRIEFGYSEKKFCTELEDYFQLFEDECSFQSHTCVGRVARVLDHVRDRVVGPPDYDPRSIVALLEKYGDAHISDSGWREVDEEEWFEQ